MTDIGDVNPEYTPKYIGLGQGSKPIYNLPEQETVHLGSALEVKQDLVTKIVGNILIGALCTVLVALALGLVGLTIKWVWSWFV